MGLEVVLGEYTLFNMARLPQLTFWVKLNNFCKAGWILSEENKETVIGKVMLLFNPIPVVFLTPVDNAIIISAEIFFLFHDQDPIFI